MRSAIFSTPRPVPARTLPLLAGAAVLVTALPVFLAAEWPLAGWAIAAALWGGGQVVSILLQRLPLGADSLAASGVVGIAMIFRAVAVGVVVIALALSDARLGISAALLYALAYTLELAVSLVTYFGSAR